MSRAPFNASTDWYYGPHSTAGTPGTPYAVATPSRIVKQEQILQFDWPYYISTAWITLDAHEPNLPEFHSPALWYLGADWLEADRVALAPFADPDWFCMRKELLAPYLGASYWRVLVGKVADVITPPWPPQSSYPYPTPPPPVCTVPGIICFFAPPQPPFLTCDYTVTFPDEQWWRVGNNGGAMVTMVFNNYDGIAQLDVYVGPDCSSLTSSYSGPMPAMQVVNPSAGEYVFIKVTAITAITSYTWSWS